MIVLNHPAITEFVADAMDEETPADSFSIGYVVDDKIKAGCVFNWFTGTNVQMHVAGTGMWAKKEFINTCFRFAFNKLGVLRVTGLVPVSNEKAIKLNEHLGFKVEGTLRMSDGYDDLLIMGMLKEECRYLGEV